MLLIKIEGETERPFQTFALSKKRYYIYITISHGKKRPISHRLKASFGKTNRSSV